MCVKLQVAHSSYSSLSTRALVRPGRFDKHVAVPLPDIRGLYISASCASNVSIIFLMAYRSNPNFKALYGGDSRFH